MNSFRFRSLLTVWCAAAFLTVACGQSTLNSPTGPSGALGSTALTADDAADGAAAASTADLFEPLGRGNGKEKNKGGGNDKDKGEKDKDGSDDDDEDGDDGDRRGSNRGPQNGRGMLSGFVTAVDTDSLTLRGIDVLVTANTRIRHGNRTLRLADISVGDHAQARGTMNAAGTIMTASEVKVEGAGDDDEDDDEDDDDEDEIELRGAVGGLVNTTGCPALTFTVGTTTVKTTSATRFDDVTCAALANGNLVEIEGRKLADGSIAATKVELQSGPNEVEGRISGLAGTTSCPTLTFMIGMTTVTTSATTQFSGVMCSALANGARVEVEGTLTGTTLAAASLELH